MIARALRRIVADIRREVAGTVFDHAPDEGEVQGVDRFVAVELARAEPSEGAPVVPVFALFIVAEDRDDALTLTDAVVEALSGQYDLALGERLNTPAGWIVTGEAARL